MAVCAVSLAAFRSIFVSDNTKSRPWYSTTVARLRRRNKLAAESRGLNDLPKFPSATLSGMRTFIEGSQLGLSPDVLEEFSDHQLLKSSEYGIHVVHEFRTS